MRLKAEAPLERRSLVLDARSVRQLKELRVETDAASDSEVVRHALWIYERLVEDDMAGKHFIIRPENGDEYDLPDVASVSDGEDRREEPLERRNLMLSERSAVRLDRLRRDTKASTESEVVRQAIMVYGLLVTNDLEGNKLITRDRDGNESQMMIPGCMETKDMHRPPRILEKLRAALTLV